MASLTHGDSWLLPDQPGAWVLAPDPGPTWNQLLYWHPQLLRAGGNDREEGPPSWLPGPTLGSMESPLDQDSIPAQPVGPRKQWEPVGLLEGQAG